MFINENIPVVEITIQTQSRKEDNHIAAQSDFKTIG